MAKPKLDRVPMVKKPTRYQVFVNNEMSKIKLHFPTLNIKLIREKAVEKWRQFKKLEKCKRSPKGRKSPGSKTVSFCDEVSVKSPTPNSSFEPVEPRKHTLFKNKVKTITSPAGIMKSPKGTSTGNKKKKNILKSKYETSKLRRSIIYFSPKKDNQEIVPVSNFPKFQNNYCSWSYKKEVNAEKLNQDLDHGSLKKQQKEKCQLVYSKRKEISLDKENSSYNLKLNVDEEEAMIEEVSPVFSLPITKTPSKRGQYQNVVVRSPFSKKARNNMGVSSRKFNDETFDILKCTSTSSKICLNEQPMFDKFNSKDCEEAKRKVSRTLVIEEWYNKELTQNKLNGLESCSPSSSDYQSAHDAYDYLKFKTKEISPILKRLEDVQSDQSSPSSNSSDWTRDTRIIDRGPEMSKSIYLSSQSMSEDPFAIDFTKPGSGNFEKNPEKSEDPFPNDYDRPLVPEKITKTRNKTLSNLSLSEDPFPEDFTKPGSGKAAKTSVKTLSQQTVSEKPIPNDIQTSRRQDDRTKTIEKNKDKLIFKISSGIGSEDSKKENQMDSIEETMAELEIIPGKFSNSSQSSLSGSLAYDVIPPTPIIENQKRGPPSISLSAETLPFSRNRFMSKDNLSSLNNSQDSEVKSSTIYDYESPSQSNDKNYQDPEVKSSKASTIYNYDSPQSVGENFEVKSTKASTVYGDDGDTFLALKDVEDIEQHHFYDNEDPLLPIKDSKYNTVSESPNSISQFEQVKNKKKNFFNPLSEFDRRGLHSSPHNRSRKMIPDCGNNLSLNHEDLEMNLVKESEMAIKRKTCEVVFDLEAELAKRAKLVESMDAHLIINKLDNLALEESELFGNSTKTQLSFTFPSQIDKTNDISIEASATSDKTSSDLFPYGSSDQRQKISRLEKETVTYDITKKSAENDDFDIDIDNFSLSAEASRHGLDLSRLSPINKEDIEDIPDYIKKMAGWKVIFDKSF